MNYTVIWTVTAEGKLITIWTDSNDRREVTNAANTIDRRLKIDPESEGESRELDRRILLVPPLGVKFRVLQDDKKVRVLDVWRFETHKPGS